MDVVSIFENVSQFIPIPEKLKDVLNVNNVEEQTVNTQTTKEELVVNDSSVNDDILNFIKEKEKENEWCDF